jgi:hypothetical protein
MTTKRQKLSERNEFDRLADRKLAGDREQAEDERLLAELDEQRTSAQRRLEQEMETNE